MTEPRNLTAKQIELLNKIHELALSDEYTNVPYSNDRLKMAHAVIENAQKKFYQIAELVQVVCGD